MGLTEQFYKELEAKIYACYYEYEMCDDEQSFDDEFSVDFGNGDDALVEVELTLYGEWIDESFDHAFGTWDDPHPHYEAKRAVITDVYSVEAEDWDGNRIEISDEDYKMINGFEVTL